MSQAQLSASHLALVQPQARADTQPANLLKFMNLLGIQNTSASAWIERLPFGPGDTTAGTETELQTVVI